MIEEDLRTALIGEATISTIIGSRMYLRSPIDTQTDTYINYLRTARARDIVSDQSRFKLVLYSKSMSELLTLASAIIDFLEGKKVLNSNPYYSLSFVNQADGDGKLEDGFFWSTIEYEFKETT